MLWTLWQNTENWCVVVQDGESVVCLSMHLCWCMFDVQCFAFSDRTWRTGTGLMSSTGTFLASQNAFVVVVVSKVHI